jgi:DNA repair protein RadC
MPRFNITTQLAKDSEGLYEISTTLFELILRLLPRISREKANKLQTELSTNIPGTLTIDQLGFLSPREAEVVLSAIELGRIAWTSPNKRLADISSPQASFEALSETLRGQASELVVALFLNVKNELLSTEVVARGSWKECIIPVPEIFRLALAKQAQRIIVGHNHPSGSLEPSSEDFDATHSLVKAGEVIGINVLDHLVVTDDGYNSIRQTSPNLWS